MRRIPHPSLGLLLSVVLAGVSFGGDMHVLTDDLSFEESSSGIQTVRVESVNGYIRVIGTDGEQIEIQAHRVVKSDSEERGSEYRDQFVPDVSRSGEVLEIETLRPGKLKWTKLHVESASMDYEIRMPRHLQCNAQTVNGDAEFSEITGGVWGESTNGDIEARSEMGLLNGLVARTTNGEIRAEVAGIGSESQLAAVNGGVRLKIRESLSGPIEAETVNGSLTIELPPEAGFELSALVAVGGSIRSDWGVVSEKRIVGKSLHTTVNGGGPEIKLNTVNGSIKIRKQP